MNEIDKGAKSRTVDESSKSEISTKAKDMAKALSVASAAPDVREDRVAELKKRIADGSYKVDNEAVADKMISEHMSF